MVSRETLIAEGLHALGLPHGSDAEVIRRLVALTESLETEAIPRGFIGQADADRLVPRHVLESAALNGFLPSDGILVDVGSGAGLPGLVLACLRRDRVVLVEPMAKRAAFLREVVHRLELRAEVIQLRAEDAARGELRESAAVVTARALAPNVEALELLLPFAQPGGVVAILVGPSDVPGRVGPPRAGAKRVPRAAGDVPGVSPLSSSAGVAAAALGGGELVASRFEVPGAEESRWVMIVHKLRRTPDLYPRPPQARRRRPLGGSVA